MVKLSFGLGYGVVLEPLADSVGGLVLFELRYLLPELEDARVHPLLDAFHRIASLHRVRFAGPEITPSGQ
jgi:hypothetical protein